MRSLLTLILCLVPFLLKGQDKYEDLKRYKSYKRQERVRAQRQILELKESIIMVRLPEKIKKVEILNKLGKLEKAKDVEAKQKKINKTTVKAFQDKFDFCPTYFFFSSDSKKIIDKDLKEVKFVDENFDVVEFKHWESEFYTAEFGIVGKDTLSFSDSEGYNTGSPMISAFGVVVKSDKFYRLVSPFPFYVEISGANNTKNFPKTVATLNKNLFFYYKKIKAKEGRRRKRKLKREKRRNRKS